MPFESVFFHRIRRNAERRKREYNSKKKYSNSKSLPRKIPLLVGLESALLLCGFIVLRDIFGAPGVDAGEVGFGSGFGRGFGGEFDGKWSISSAVLLTVY